MKKDFQMAASILESQASALRDDGNVRAAKRYEGMAEAVRSGKPLTRGDRNAAMDVWREHKKYAEDSDERSELAGAARALRYSPKASSARGQEDKAPSKSNKNFSPSNAVPVGTPGGRWVTISGRRVYVKD